MSTVGEVVAIFSANTVDFDRGVANVQRKTAELGASSTNMARVGALAWGALGAAAIGFGAIAVKQAQEQEVATARLKQAITNVGQSYADYAGQIGKAESAGIKLGFANDEVTAGLSKLVPATKDVHRSITDMGLAEDIARGRHIDLSAATDLLVKVETGHVALLGRIGINTKDATGATISQGEAIKRLTDMYGGQAAAYTQTFAGRIEVLKTQFGELAEKVGFVLIPVLESLMTGISDTVGFFEKNKAAALALATIIGGPLVYAMGAFVAVKIGAFVESLVTSFVTLRAAVAATVEAIVADAGLMAIGVLGPLALIAGALSFMVLGDGPYEKAKAAASSWASKTIAAAKSSGDEFAALKDKQKGLTAQIDLLTSAQKTLSDAIAQGKPNAQTYRKSLDEISLALLNAQSKHDALVPRIKELKQQMLEANITAQATAQMFGVTIPDSYSKSEKTSKDFATALTGAVGAFGTMGAQAFLNAGLSVTAMQSLTKEAQQFSQDFAAGIQAATDPWQHFQNETAVTEQQMEEFFTKSNGDAIAWSQDLKGTFDQIHTSLSGSAEQAVAAYVANIAKLGPSAKPALDAFVEMANEHGWQWVADNLAAVTAAEGDTQAAYAAMTAAAAVSAAEQAAVMVAAQDLISGHGSEKFHDLLNSADANLRAIANAALLQLGYTQSQIDQLHGKDVNINVQSNVDAAVAHIQAMIDAIGGGGGPSNPVANTPGNIGFQVMGAHGLVAMARGGFVTGGPQMALIGEDGPEAVLPFTKYDDMVATIANTGQAPRIARAAAQAAGQLASNSGLNGLTGSFNIDQAAGPGSTPDAMKTLILSQVSTATKLALNSFWQAQDDAQRASDAALYTTLSTFMQSASVTADSVRQLMQSVLDDFWSTTDEAQRANDAALFQTLNTQLRTLSGSGYSQPGSPDGTGVISGNGTVTNGNGTVTGTVKLDSSDLKDIITQLIAVLGRVVTSEDGLSQSEGDLALMIGQLNSTLGIGYSPNGGFLTTRG